MMGWELRSCLLRFTDIMLGDNGGTWCRRCHGAREETLRNPADVIADVRAAVDSWDAAPGPNIALAGAEPFRHPAIATVVADAVEAGAQRIRLDSDCSGFSSATTAEAVIGSGVRHVQFTLLGSMATLHDSLCGTAGAFERTIRGAKTFAEVARASNTPVQLSAHVPVCRHTIRDIAGIVGAAATAGASLVHLALVDEHLAPAAAAPWIGAACDTGVVNAVWVEVGGVPFCLAAGWELHLAPIYRSVEGAKAAACGRCPLDGVCGGAPQGAGGAVLAALQPPADADGLAARISRSFEPPAGSHA